MKSTQNFVSIIMPNYNGAKYLKDSVTSVLNQTYTNWELIIVDDHSTDNSLEVLNSFVLDNRILIIEQPCNKGVELARNKGIYVAKGNYIAFLDSDDKWAETKLEKQIAFMEKNNVGFSYTSYFMISSAGEKINKHVAPMKIEYDDLLVTCDIGCSSVIYNTDVIGKQMFFTKSIIGREDYILWLNILKQFPNVMFGLDEPLMLYRKHDAGSSSNKFTMLKRVWKVYRKFEKLNIFTSTYYILRYTYNGLLKHYVR